MDPRVQSWFEAEENLKASQRHSVEEPIYWAYLLCALGNATMAAMSDSVMEGVAAEKVRRLSIQKKIQRNVQKQIKDRLNG